MTIQKEWFSFKDFDINLTGNFYVMNSNDGSVDYLSHDLIVRDGNYINDYWIPKGYVWKNEN